MDNRRLKIYKLLFIIALLVCSLPGLAQTVVKGVVKDSKDGSSLPGVNVTVKDAAGVGATTGVDGTFILKAPKSSGVLRFSFIGYNSKEVAFSGNDNLTVTLDPENLEIKEVVVTALGIKREKKSLGYALSEVKGEGLTQTRDPNVINSLSGKVAGLQIKQSGTGPSGSSRIIIRGNNSIGNNNQPLVVVDGVPIDNTTGGTDDFWGNRNVDKGSGISDISPDDIESMSVLKGPAAAALYGSRAGNGVIMITTKKGALKGYSLNFNTNLTFDSPMQTPSFQNVYGQGINGQFDVSRADSWGAKMTGQSVNALMGQKKYLPDGNNLYKDFLRTGTTWTNSVDLATSKDNSTVRVGVTRLDNKGVIPNSRFDRTSLNIRATNKINRFSTDVKLNYINQNTKNRIKLAGDPDNIFRNYLIMPRSVSMDDYRAFEKYGYGISKNGAPATYIADYGGMSRNPFWSAFRNTNEDKKDRVIGMVSLQYDFTSWLNLKVRYGLDLQKTQYTDRLATGTPYWGTGEYSGDYRVISEMIREQNADFLFTAQGNVFSKLNVVGTFGGNVMNSRSSNQLAQAQGLVIPNFYSVSNGSIREASYNYFEKQINSFYGMGSFSWDNFAFVDVTLRNDVSSTLPSSNRSYVYPSVGGSLLVKEFLEKFGVNTGPVNFAKFRASWAEVGNDTQAYQLLNYYNAQFVGGVMTLTPNNYKANPNLKPESIRSWEIGADVKMFQSRLGLDVSYYKKNAYDQILKIQKPASFGYQFDLVNAGNVQNSGVEVMLTGIPVRTRNFEWTSILNFSKNNNKIVELLSDTKRQVISDPSVSSFITVVAEVGGSYGDMYGTAYKRNSNGQILVDDNGIPLPGDNMKLGNYQPKWMGGFQNNFKIYGVDLGFMIDMRYGGKVFMGSIRSGATSGTLDMTLDGRDGFVVPNSVVASTGNANTIKVSAQNYWSGISPITEAWIYDATNVRLRELSLGYSIPQQFVKKLGINGLKVSAVARNVFMIYSKTKGFDPEAAYSTGNAQGIEFGSMPTLRSIGFNVNVSF